MWEEHNTGIEELPRTMRVYALHGPNVALALQLLHSLSHLRSLAPSSSHPFASGDEVQLGHFMSPRGPYGILYMYYISL